MAEPDPAVHLPAPDPSPSPPVVLITGAARGVGAATARLLAGAGWRVVLVDVADGRAALGYPRATPADLDHAVAAARLAAGGDDGAAMGVVADVTDQASLDGAVAAAVSAFGGLDALVVAAGGIAGGPELWRLTEQAWHAMVDLNLTGAWRTVRAAVPELLARPEPRRGRVVVVASSAAFVGLPRLGAYTAAKTGVLGLVRALAVELAPHGVTANAVCPGSTRTAMLDASAAVYGLDSVEEFAVHHPLGRLVEPDEVAAAIAWLCSPESSAVTGAALPVDAGMTAT